MDVRGRANQKEDKKERWVPKRNSMKKSHIKKVSTEKSAPVDPAQRNYCARSLNKARASPLRTRFRSVFRSVKRSDMSSEKRSANALGGKTVRPCDSCLCKRARWYCAADDAFLCQACDASVHSANQLASRHERLSLKTGSGSPIRPEPLPPWLGGFRRKARTPRHSKPKQATERAQIPLLVPDLSSSGDDSSPPDDEQLLYRVPIFDPVADASLQLGDPLAASNSDESKPSITFSAAEAMMDFASCDADLAADMDILLGKDLDSDSFCMDALGLIDTGNGEMEWQVKAEEVEELALDTARHVESELDLSCDTLDLKFECESPTTTMPCEDEEMDRKKKICLRLDYESVITAWASHGSPWMNGDRPNFNPDDCWPDWTVLISPFLFLFLKEKAPIFFRVL